MANDGSKAVANDGSAATTSARARASASAARPGSPPDRSRVACWRQLYGLVGRTPSRSLSSWRATSVRPSRCAASSSVRWTTSRWAWLPPKTWTRWRIGSSRSTTSPYRPCPKATRARQTGRPTSAVNAQIAVLLRRGGRGIEVPGAVGNERLGVAEPAGADVGHDRVGVVERVVRDADGAAPGVGQDAEPLGLGVAVEVPPPEQGRGVEQLERQPAGVGGVEDAVVHGQRDVRAVGLEGVQAVVPPVVDPEEVAVVEVLDPLVHEPEPVAEASLHLVRVSYRVDRPDVRTVEADRLQPDDLAAVVVAGLLEPEGEHPEQEGVRRVVGRPGRERAADAVPQRRRPAGEEVGLVTGGQGQHVARVRRRQLGQQVAGGQHVAAEPRVGHRDVRPLPIGQSGQVRRGQPRRERPGRRGGGVGLRAEHPEVGGEDLAHRHRRVGRDDPARPRRAGRRGSAGASRRPRPAGRRPRASRSSATPGGRRSAARRQCTCGPVGHRRSAGFHGPSAGKT